MLPPSTSASAVTVWNVSRAPPTTTAAATTRSGVHDRGWDRLFAVSDRAPVYCAYCEQQLEIGDGGQVVAVGGQDCSGPRHSPRRTCDRCGGSVHVDFSGVEQAPPRSRIEPLRYLASPTSYKLVDASGNPHCPVGGTDGHSMNSSRERMTSRWVLVGFIVLCLAAVAYFIATANNSPSSEIPAGAGDRATNADCYRLHNDNGCL